MKKRTERARKGKPEALELRSLAATWRQVLLPMIAGIVTTKKALHEWVLDFGMAALVGLMEADAERVVGCRKGGHQKGRKLGHWGYADTPFPFDGRQVVLPRPRVRTVDKHQEVSVPLVKQLQSLDPMTERVVEQILLGVSTRGYEQSLGPMTAELRTKGARKSRVSEMLVAETRRRMKEDMTLSGHDHDYERSFPVRGSQKVSPGQGVVHVVAGGFYAPGYSAGTDWWTQKSVSGNVSNYLVIEVQDRALHAVAYSGDGNQVLDDFSLTK